jgi:hypothetical protein
MINVEAEDQSGTLTEAQTGEKSKDEMQAMIEAEVKTVAKQKGAQFLDIKFGTVVDSRDDTVPDEVKAKAPPGTKVYPARWHGRGICYFLDGTWKGSADVVTFVQDIYYFTDKFGEIDAIGDTAKVTESKAGGLFNGLQVHIGLN